MKILLLNPNTTREVTELLLAAGQAVGGGVDREAGHMDETHLLGQEHGFQEARYRAGRRGRRRGRPQADAGRRPAPRWHLGCSRPTDRSGRARPDRWYSPHGSPSTWIPTQIRMVPPSRLSSAAPVSPASPYRAMVGIEQSAAVKPVAKPRKLSRAAGVIAMPKSPAFQQTGRVAARTHQIGKAE